jgi:hypothetical protein
LCFQGHTFSSTSRTYRLLRFDLRSMGKFISIYGLSNDGSSSDFKTVALIGRLMHADQEEMRFSLKCYLGIDRMS